MNSNVEFLVENKKNNHEKVKEEQNPNLWPNGKIKYKTYKPNYHSKSFQVSTFENGIQEYVGKIDIDSGICDKNGCIFSKDGLQVRRGSVHNNLLDGLGMKQSINPLQIEIGNFVDDKLFGLDCYIIWKNGNLAFHGGMDHGLKHNKGRVYYASGNLEFDGQFIYDKKHGNNCITYHEDGRIKHQGEWRDGKFLDGKKVTYDLTTNRKHNFFSDDKDLQNFKPLTSHYDSGYNNNIRQILNSNLNENQPSKQSILAKKPARPGSAIHSTKITSFQKENNKFNTRPTTALRGNEDLHLTNNLIDFNIAETVHNLDQHSYFTEADVVKHKNLTVQLSNLDSTNAQSKKPQSENYRNMSGTNFKIRNQPSKKVDFLIEDEFKKNTANDAKAIDFLNDPLIIGLNIKDSSLDDDTNMIYGDEKLNSNSILGTLENRAVSFKSNMNKNNVKYKDTFFVNNKKDKLKENQDYNVNKMNYSKFDTSSNVGYFLDERSQNNNEAKIKSYTNIGIPKYKRNSRIYENDKPSTFLAPSERAEAKKNQEALQDPNKHWKFYQNGTKERSKVIKLKKDREASNFEESSILKHNGTTSKLSSNIKYGYDGFAKTYDKDYDINNKQQGWLKNMGYKAGWKKAEEKPNLFKSSSINQMKDKKVVKKETLINNLNKKQKNSNFSMSHITKKYGHNQFRNDNINRINKNNDNSNDSYENSNMYDGLNMLQQHKNEYTLLVQPRQNDDNVVTNFMENTKNNHNTDRTVRFNEDVGSQENHVKNKTMYDAHHPQKYNKPKSHMDIYDDENFDEFYHIKGAHATEKQFFNKENSKIKSQIHPNSASRKNRPMSGIKKNMQHFDLKNNTNISKLKDQQKDIYVNSHLKNKINEKFHILDEIKDLKKDEIKANKEITNFLHTNDNGLHPLAKNLELNLRFNTKLKKKNDFSVDSNHSEIDKDLQVDYDDPISVQLHKVNERVRIGNEIRGHCYKPMEKAGLMKTVDINRIYGNK